MIVREMVGGSDLMSVGWYELCVAWRTRLIFRLIRSGSEADRSIGAWWFGFHSDVCSSLIFISVVFRLLGFCA